MGEFLLGFGVTMISLIIGWALGKAGQEGPPGPVGPPGPMGVSYSHDKDR